jgi:hypothetical protein
MLSYILAELPQWLETIATDLSKLWPIVLFIGAGYGLIKWLSNKFRDEVRDLIVGEVEPIKAEFKNNGGSSFKDAIDRLDDNFKNLRADVNHIKSDVDSMRLELTRIDKESQDAHKALSDKVGLISGKNDSIWDEMQRRRPAHDYYDSEMKKRTKSEF